MALNLPIIINTEAPKELTEINNFIKELLSLIVHHAQCNDKIKKNVKFILIELVTNAIKHVSEVDNTIRVILNLPEKIEILKVDNGCKLDVKALLQENHYQNYQLRTVAVDCWQFYILHQQAIQLEQLPEHFGFEIIIRASSSFTYEFNAETEENVFKAIIRLE